MSVKVAYKLWNLKGEAAVPNDYRGVVGSPTVLRSAVDTSTLHAVLREVTTLWRNSLTDYVLSPGRASNHTEIHKNVETFFTSFELQANGIILLCFLSSAVARIITGLPEKCFRSWGWGTPLPSARTLMNMDGFVKGNLNCISSFI